MTGAFDRSQSSIDFVIGFGVFFLTLSFVLILLPELLSPFAGPEGPVVAARSADVLAGDLLAGGAVGTLDETCTEEFFDGSGSSCSFDASDSMTTIVGVSDTYNLNVTIEGNVSGDAETEILCYNGTAVLDCGAGGDRLARGDSPPRDTQSVRTVTRTVRIDGRVARLKQRVW